MNTALHHPGGMAIDRFLYEVLSIKSNLILKILKRKTKIVEYPIDKY